MPGSIKPILLVLLLGSTLGCGPSGESAAPQPLTLFAAAGTARVVQAAATAWEEKTGTPVRLSLAASSTLARQISAGARADVYISANDRWMQFLVDEKLVPPHTVTPLATTRLVLVVPADNALRFEFTGGPDMAALIPGRLSIGDPDHVPVGIYARAALERLGCWQALEPRIVPAPDVRSALRAVALGQCDSGIVYETELAGTDKLRVAAVLPASSHPPIRFSIATTREAAPGAAALRDFIAGPEAARHWAAAGFLPPPPAP